MSGNYPLQILETITTAFVESGSIFDKTSDDLRYEMEFQNDQTIQNDPDAVEVTLVELLQASMGTLKIAPENLAQTHIHHLIEYAFIEQEALRAIETLWPATKSTTLLPEHLPLLTATVGGHLSENGLTVLDEVFAQARQRAAAKSVQGGATETELQVLTDLGKEAESTSPRSFSGIE